MNIIRHIPMFLYLLIFSNIAAFSNILDVIIIEYQLISGAVLKFSVDHLLISIGVIGLYIEIFKSTRSTTTSIIDHALSMVVFVIFLIEFITVKSTGTASFLILTLMSMFDVVAGFTVSISSARRDIGIVRD